MSSSLRDEVARIVQNAVREGEGSLLGEWALTYADDILAIPEIAEALRMPRAYYPNGIPRGDPGGCEAHPKRG